jgi:hypothetical protein
LAEKKNPTILCGIFGILCGVSKFLCIYSMISRGTPDEVERKADSTRALKTRQLRGPTKRMATPAGLFNEEIYKNTRSNLDERF